MPYSAGTADLTIGPQKAAKGIESAMGGLNDMFKTMGMMHMQDQAAGVQLDALKAAGQFDPQPGGGPDSAAIPFGGVLYSAAQKGPLGTKQAILGTLNRFMEMNYQMQLYKRKFMMEGGGAMPPGGQGQGQQPPAPQQRSQ